LVRTHSAPFWCWDKPRATLDSFDSPRPGLKGSHHLPPYSIFYSSPPHLRPNGSFSRDSQSGVPKLSRFELSGLWALITSHPEFGSRQGLNQSCSSLQELFNNMSHFTCTHRNRVNSRLLVVGSQIASLTFGPSFDHNLCCRCPNGSCEAILDIYTSKPFQWYKKRINARCFDPCNHALSSQESRRTPKSHFRECEWRLHNSLKVGLRHTSFTMARTWGKPPPFPLWYILCLSTRPTFKWHFVSGLPNGSPKILKVGTSVTLGPHNFVCRPPIEMRFEAKLYNLSRAFQRYVASHLHARKSGRFLTFNGRESNYQFDSRLFFWP